MKNIHYYRRKILSWLLPYSCILCGYLSYRDQDICTNCFNELPILIYTCPRCARPCHDKQQNIICAECLKHPTPYDCTHALFFYQTPITKLIMDLKFGEALVNARVLGELLAEQIKSTWYCNKPLPNVIIPIPLHPKRLRDRGFNQALEIARPIARHLQLPLDITHCQRIKSTAAQATLPATERHQNVKNAFHIPNQLPYSHVAVIDDVITTGFTMTEFCHGLKQAGVKKIDVWCCARPQL